MSTDLFVRVHRACIVNIDHVVSYDDDSNQLEMSNGTSIPVSRRNKKELIS
ncbi:MAG: LytTR family transcriptional regulator [Saprospiraceae bacterium]|nr:LytTR family transcriptional regulator [Saprospiraceae bacterium]